MYPLVSPLAQILPRFGVWMSTPKAAEDSQLYYDFAGLVKPFLRDPADYNRLIIAELFEDRMRAKRNTMRLLERQVNILSLLFFLVTSTMTTSFSVQCSTPTGTQSRFDIVRMKAGGEQDQAKITGCGTSTLDHQPRQASTGLVYLQPSTLPEKVQQKKPEQGQDNQYRSPCSFIDHGIPLPNG
ncbi:MAG: hypothetical protein M1812_007437 [Candelaria pacifica]|nr:MAG: hypothetical protein M1812_007437 [Candelaria pacifica]